MNWNDTQKAWFAALMAVTLLWAASTPKVYHEKTGQVFGCSGASARLEQMCVYDVGTMSFRFLAGAAVAFSLAVGAVGLSPREKEEDEES